MKLFPILVFLFVGFNYCFAQTSNDLGLADIEFQKANYDGAIELYTKVIDSGESSDKFTAYYGRAQCFYQLKQDDSATSDVEEALKVKRGNENYAFIKGNSYWLYSLIVSRERSTMKSLELLQKASLYIPSSLLYSTIGFDQIYLEKYEDAVESLNTSILLDSTNAWAYSNRALANLKLNKVDLARKDVVKSIELDDQNPFVYKHSAMIYFVIGKKELACQDLVKAISLKPTGRMADHTYDEIEKLREEYCKSN